MNEIETLCGSVGFMLGLFALVRGSYGLGGFLIVLTTFGVTLWRIAYCYWVAWFPTLMPSLRPYLVGFIFGVLLLGYINYRRRKAQLGLPMRPSGSLKRRIERRG